MPIESLHCYLVHPSKGEEEQPEIRGASVPLRGKLFQMLNRMYEEAETECDIEIVFRPSLDGSQANPCRDLLLDYLRDPSMEPGTAIAGRLQRVTTHRSGLGLLFLAAGQVEPSHRLLLARFPADQGIIAHEREHRIDVEFLERVFMKSAKAYKSAVYSTRSVDAGFWDGRAADRQINAAREISLYWIHEFLDSELRTTAAAGTKRLAVALREAIRQAPDASVRGELLSAAQLVRGKAGQTISPQSMAEDFSLSPSTVEQLMGSMPRPELFEERFRFDREEFERHVTYRLVELDNGAILMAASTSFDSVFEQVPLAPEKGLVRYATEGRVVDEQLRKTR